MPEQTRPSTQLGDFFPTVAGDPLQSTVTTISNTQASKVAPVRKDSLIPSGNRLPETSNGLDQTGSIPSVPKLSDDRIDDTKFENQNVKWLVKGTHRGPYEEFMTLDQAGPVMIGSENSEEPNLVAIKRIKKASGRRINPIKPFHSDHLVQIKDMYDDGEHFVIVYETMDVSLRQLTGMLQGPLKAFQIAAICKELVDGLSYLHKELGCYHGAISCGTILLNLDGRVKIANVGELLIENRVLNADDERKDIQSIGSVMMELMEPDTFILKPRSTVLRNTELWRDGHAIKDFLAATQQSTLEILVDHDFLPKKPIWKCLRPHVFCAVRAANLGCDIISMP